MIITASNQTFQSHHRDGDIFQIILYQDNIARVTGEFTTKEMVEIIEGLTSVVLQQAMTTKEDVNIIQALRKRLKETPKFED